MLVHKGGKIKNWGGECRDVTPTKLQSQKIFKKSMGGGTPLNRGRISPLRIEVFVKIQKKNWGGGGGGGGPGGGGGGDGGGSGWM